MLASIITMRIQNDTRMDIIIITKMVTITINRMVITTIAQMVTIIMTIRIIITRTITRMIINKALQQTCSFNCRIILPIQVLSRLSITLLHEWVKRIMVLSSIDCFLYQAHLWIQHEHLWNVRCHFLLIIIFHHQFWDMVIWMKIKLHSQVILIDVQLWILSTLYSICGLWPYIQKPLQSMSMTMTQTPFNPLL